MKLIIKYCLHLPGYHRRGGPVGAEKSRWYSPIRIHATEALQGLGFPMQDINGRRQFGNAFRLKIYHIFQHSK